MVVTQLEGLNNRFHEGLWTTNKEKKFTEIILGVSGYIQKQILIHFLSMKTKHEIASLLFQSYMKNPRFLLSSISQYLDLYLLDDGIIFSFLEKVPYFDPTPKNTSIRIEYKEVEKVRCIAAFCSDYNLTFRKIVVMTLPLNIFIKWYLPYTKNVELVWKTNFDITFINLISDEVWEKVSSIEFTKWDANNDIRKTITYKFKKKENQSKKDILLNIPYSVGVTMSDFENKHELYELSMFTKKVRCPVTLNELDNILSFYDFLSCNSLVPDRGIDKRVNDMIPFNDCIKHVKCDYNSLMKFSHFKNLKAVTVFEPTYPQFNNIFKNTQLKYIDIHLCQRKFNFIALVLPNVKDLTLRFSTLPQSYLIDLTLSELEYLKVSVARESSALNVTCIPPSLVLVLLQFCRHGLLYHTYYQAAMEKLKPLLRFNKNPNYSSFIT